MKDGDSTEEFPNVNLTLEEQLDFVDELANATVSLRTGGRTAGSGYDQQPACKVSHVDWKYDEAASEMSCTLLEQVRLIKGAFIQRHLEFKTSDAQVRTTLQAIAAARAEGGKYTLLLSQSGQEPHGALIFR